MTAFYTKFTYNAIVYNWQNFILTLYEKVIYIWQINVFLQYFLLNILCKFYLFF